MPTETQEYRCSVAATKRPQTIVFSVRPMHKTKLRQVERTSVSVPALRSRASQADFSITVHQSVKQTKAEQRTMVVGLIRASVCSGNAVPVLCLSCEHQSTHMYCKVNAVAFKFTYLVTLRVRAARTSSTTGTYSHFFDALLKTLKNFNPETIVYMLNECIV